MTDDINAWFRQRLREEGALLYEEGMQDMASDSISDSEPVFDDDPLADLDRLLNSIPEIHSTTSHSIAIDYDTIVSERVDDLRAHYNIYLTNNPSANHISARDHVLSMFPELPTLDRKLAKMYLDECNTIYEDTDTLKQSHTQPQRISPVAPVIASLVGAYIVLQDPRIRTLDLDVAIGSAMCYLASYTGLGALAGLIPQSIRNYWNKDSFKKEHEQYCADVDQKEQLKLDILAKDYKLIMAQSYQPERKVKTNSLLDRLKRTRI